MTENPSHVERRSDPRFLARIAIFSGPSLKELVSDYSVNVSSGGLFIETDKILPLDTMLMVKFKLPGEEAVIACKSRVAWINEHFAPKKPSLPPGMGIQFIDLSIEDMHAIRHYIDKGELIPTW